MFRAGGGNLLGMFILLYQPLSLFLTLIQLYRDLTVVKVGDGHHTSFWLDSWIGNKPLSIQFLVLFSHVQQINVTVAESFTEIGWQLRFRHITSQRTEWELGDLMNIIDDITLNEEPDTRYMRFGPHKIFSVKACYYAMNYGGVTILGNTDICNSLAPKKCKIFAWLALHNRINTRERLSRKGIISQSMCPFGCQCVESLTHLLFSCPHSNRIWQKFLIPVQNGQGFCFVQDIITSPMAAPPIYHKEWVTIFIAVAWNIWLTRNQKVFDNCNISTSQLVNNCRDTLSLWAHRCKQESRRNELRTWAMLENRNS
jgi:hypothetical protein